jgi:hypothetical protein
MNSEEFLILDDCLWDSYTSLKKEQIKHMLTNGRHQHPQWMLSLSEPQPSLCVCGKAANSHEPSGCPQAFEIKTSSIQ